MYKSLSLAALLFAIVALTSFVSPVGAAPGASPTPMIVAKGKLTNQTATIPTTTIFTPINDGLYRLSVYGATTTADPNSSLNWNYNIAWTDDAGGQYQGGLVYAYPTDAVTGPFSGIGGTYGAVISFEAKQGTAITYSVSQNGAGGTDNSTYSLYYTLERLD